MGFAPLNTFRSRGNTGNGRGTIGPYGSLARLDGRSREAVFIRKVRKDLLAHVGVPPTVVQRLLIERATILSLRLAQIDERILTDGLTLHDNNQAIAWQNALTRVLVALGVPKDAAPAVPSLADHLAALGAGVDEDAAA